MCTIYQAYILVFKNILDSYITLIFTTNFSPSLFGPISTEGLLTLV